MSEKETEIVFILTEDMITQNEHGDVEIFILEDDEEELMGE